MRRRRLSLAIAAISVPALALALSGAASAAVTSHGSATAVKDLYSERTVVRLTRMLCADNAKRAYQLADQM